MDRTMPEPNGLKVADLMRRLDKFRECATEFGMASPMSEDELLHRTHLTTMRANFESALTALVTQRDAAIEKRDFADKCFATLCEDFTTDAECLPSCNSDWHDELCPVTNPQVAWRRLKQQRDAAVERVRLLEPRNVVAAVIRDVDGSYLIGKRRPEQWMGNRWCFVGGKVEPGESLENAVSREVREELGVEVIVGAMRHHQIEKYENGTWALHYFDCALLSGQIPTAIECSEFARVGANELANFDLLPVDIDIARQIALQADRDLLAARCKRLEEAVVSEAIREDWDASCGMFTSCVFCKADGRGKTKSQFVHAPDCIVLTIPPRGTT